MAKKKSGKKQEQNYGTTAAYMYPDLHDAVQNAVHIDIGATQFYQPGGDRDTNNGRSTNIMGRFSCPNGACATVGWGSKTVSILIRGYPGKKYNSVVFNQRCRSCDALGEMTLDEESYVLRVAYWLRKWEGVEMERPPHSGKNGPPHLSELCEGCKAGYCQKGKVGWVG